MYGSPYSQGNEVRGAVHPGRWETTLLLSYSGQPVPAAVQALGPDQFAITIHLSKADQEALGMESGIVTDWFLSALRTLVALRTGEVDRETAAAGIERGEATKNTWYWAINDLDTHLLPALEGIRDAAIRRHAEAGGSYGDLALAMGVKRSTAQTRRDALLATDPSEREVWAGSHAAKFAEQIHRRSMDQTTD